MQLVIHSAAWIGASITYTGTTVLRQFEQMDLYTPNSSSGIINSRDKTRQCLEDNLLGRVTFI